MKRKILVLFLIIIILFPHKFQIKDGGSHGYESVTYKIVIWNGLMANNQKSSGITIKIFHFFTVYDSFKVR